jgi:hypothetical protein
MAYLKSFKSTAQRKKAPNKRKFAQSGHPDFLALWCKSPTADVSSFEWIKTTVGRRGSKILA